METITLKLDTRSKDAKVLLQYLKSLSFVQIDKELNETTLKSLKEAENGQVIRAKNSKELIKKLLE